MTPKARRRLRRVMFTLMLIPAVGWLAVAQESAPSPPASGSRPSFTGTVSPKDGKDLRPVRIHFDAGARTYWHAHSGGQIMLVEEGRGITQVRGGPIEELVPGKAVFVPAGVAHWHGAAPNEGGTQVNLSMGDYTLIGPVSDKEYLGR